jgi:hypothetical protein
MTPLVLTAEQRKELERRRKATYDRWIYQRLTAVLTIAAGYSRHDTAHFLGADLVELDHWLCVFRNDGLDALCSLAADEANPSDH